MREHALEEGGVFGDGGTHHFGEERRGLADLGRDFGEGGEGFVRVGEEAVQHSSQSSEWLGLRSILDAARARNLYPESVPGTCTRGSSAIMYSQFRIYGVCGTA